MQIILSSLLCFILSGCSKFSSEYDDYPIQRIDTVIVSKDHPSIVNMVKKAKQMAYIQWSPVNKIHSLYGYYYPQNIYYGVPYSSVKEMDKFIGHEVSFHTFMTAVNNPFSVLYTENISEFPYHGTNCGAYYGTVCSMAVNYALGLDLPFQTDNYKKSSLFAEVYPPIPEAISEGDVLWKQGHVILVLDVSRDESGQISQVTIFESRGSTFIEIYSYDDFVCRWDEEGLVAYRYLDIASNLDYDSIPFVKLEEDPIVNFSYNNELCVSRGDQSCYREGERVEINILDNSWDFIELYKNDDILSVRKLTDDTVIYNGLSFGSYKARLGADDNTFSEFTYFEIVETNVTCRIAGKHIQVTFNSANATPEYIVVCKENGSRTAIYDLSDEEILAGRSVIGSIKNNEYIKVFFKGEFGRVSNFPMGF